MKTISVSSAIYLLILFLTILETKLILLLYLIVKFLRGNKNRKENAQIECAINGVRDMR